MEEDEEKKKGWLIYKRSIRSVTFWVMMTELISILEAFGDVVSL